MFPIKAVKRSNGQSDVIVFFDSKLCAPAIIPIHSICWERILIWRVLFFVVGTGRKGSFYSLVQKGGLNLSTSSPKKLDTVRKISPINCVFFLAKSGRASWVDNSILSSRHALCMMVLTERAIIIDHSRNRSGRRTPAFCDICQFDCHRIFL